MIEYKKMLERAAQINARQLDVLYIRMARPLTLKKDIANELGVTRHTITTDIKKLRNVFPELKNVLG